MGVYQSSEKRHLCRITFCILQSAFCLIWPFLTCLLCMTHSCVFCIFHSFLFCSYSTLSYKEKQKIHTLIFSITDKYSKFPKYLCHQQGKTCIQLSRESWSQQRLLSGLLTKTLNPQPLHRSASQVHSSLPVRSNACLCLFKQIKPEGVSGCTSTGEAGSRRRCRHRESAPGTLRGSSPWRPQPVSL